ncbi:MAG: hypothetical protein AABZ11_04285 [Nitrospinota bacterium]
MGMGLSNVKLSISKSLPKYVPGVKKVRPSIAEDAIFIPKPKKRISFELANSLKERSIVPSSQGGKEVSLTGNDTEIEEVQFLGDGSTGNSVEGDYIPVLGEMKELGKVDVYGIPDKLPALGENGISAKLTLTEYNGEPGEDYVKMKIYFLPEKDFNWDAPQEEGRQINNHEIPFHLQYDSYGRPRIGFSREPYDFAATKYIELTSKIKFNQNLDETKDYFEKYFLGNKDSEKDREALFTISGNDPEDKEELKLPGDDSKDKEVSDGQIRDKKEFEEIFFNNDKNSEEELEKVLLGKGLLPEKNNEDMNDYESLSGKDSKESNNSYSNSVSKTRSYELMSNGNTETGQFSLRV